MIVSGLEFHHLYSKFELLKKTGLDNKTLQSTYNFITLAIICAVISAGGSVYIVLEY